MPTKTPAKRSNYKSKRPSTLVVRKNRKAPLNKRQYSAVSKLVKKQLYKTSETKYQFRNIDHTQGIILDGAVVKTTTANDGINQIPMPGDTDALNGRDGNAIQPVSWQFQGHMTIPGSSSNQDNRTCHVRLVAGFYDKDDPLNVNLTDSDLFRFANNVGGLSSDFADTYKNINWGKVRPFYDRVFTLQPGLGHTDDTGANIIFQSAPNRGRDVAKLNIKHFFPKGMKLTVPGTNELDYDQNKNIVMFAITRNVNDAYPNSALELKILGVSQFAYKDF